MNGLLDMGQSQGAPIGGLLGSGMPQQSTQNGSNEIAQAQQMVNALIQNPTPDTVKMIIGELQKNPSKESQMIIGVLSEHANDPKSLVEIAQTFGAALK